MQLSNFTCSGCFQTEVAPASPSSTSPAVSAGRVGSAVQAASGRCAPTASRRVLPAVGTCCLSEETTVNIF